MTENLPCRPRDCGYSGESALCAGALRARPALSPGLRLPRPPELRLRKPFRVRLLGRQTEAAPAQCSHSAALKIWPVLGREYLAQKRRTYIAIPIF